MSHQESIGEYVLDRSLGDGATAKVRLARHRVTGKQYAVKIIKKAIFKDDPGLLPKVQREIALMRLLNHPNLLFLHDILESDHHIFIVEGFAENGSLFDVISQLTVTGSMQFFRQIIYGLEYLHLHGICHRDLKPENILLNFANELWIADFGFARWMPNNVANTSCGSPLYAAPEVIRGVPYDGRRADVWSAGVILYAMLSGNLPFNCESVRATCNKIKKGAYKMPQNIDPILQDLIANILVVDVQKRYSIHQIKSHPAFRIGLPDDYILPCPFPLPTLSSPIILGPDDDASLEALQQVGFTDTNELRRLLQSNEPNMAKVFFFMLTTTQDVESIDWESATIATPSDNPAFMISGEEGSNYLIEHTPPFNLSSFETATKWGPQPIVTPISESGELTEGVIQNISTCPVGLMHLLQQFLTFRKFRFFYPDEFTLVCKNQEGDVYVTLTSYFETPMTMALKIQTYKASIHQYSAFVKAVSALVREMISEPDEFLDNPEMDEFNGEPKCSPM